MAVMGREDVLDAKTASGFMKLPTASGGIDNSVVTNIK
jgi:hypothetical protein